MQGKSSSCTATLWDRTPRNPQAVIEWEIPDYANLPEHATCPLGTICNQMAGRLDINDTERSMTITADWRDNGGLIMCTATNEETYKVAENMVTLDVQHKPIWNGAEDDRLIYASLGDNVTLHCDVRANPPTHNFTWTYIGRVTSKDDYEWCDPWIVECDPEEDCTWKRWEGGVGGSYVIVDDPCGEVTPNPEIINWSQESLTLTIDEDTNGKKRFGVYRCTATNDHGSGDFDIEVEDKD
jgi:hypothetical protein